MLRTRLIPILTMAGLVFAAGPVFAQDSAQQPAPVSPAMAAPLEQSRQAIAECRERRLRRELATYKQSAECSSPKIFAAWKEAGYPHMDLITAWLTGRENASDEVDRKAITEREFERQMAELTNRLTAEERRRRLGLVSMPDSNLQLQLPPAAQVLGVAVPAGKEKQAAKRSAIARSVADSQFVDPASGTQLQNLAPMASLNAQKPPAKSGVGGPFVPVSTAGAGGLYAHVASQRSEADARTAFRMLQTQYPTILGGREAVIRRADDSDGAYYRVEVGPLTAGQADQLCGSMRAAGGQCAPRSE